MSVYETEEEQVEAIKKWWKENGTSIIAGVVLGLGGVFGWQAWNGYQDRIGGEASVAFSQLIGAAKTADPASASKQAELLRSEFESTSYAVLAAMVEARLKLEQGDRGAARSQLEWAMQHSDNPSLKTLARLDLARVLLSDGELKRAAELADVTDGGFAADFAELRGDIAAEQKRLDAAREAYTQALALNAADPQRLQMKLDDLAGVTP